jgi:hypothetical protein
MCITQNKWTYTLQHYLYSSQWHIVIKIILYIKYSNERLDTVRMNLYSVHYCCTLDQQFTNLLWAYDSLQHIKPLPLNMKCCFWCGHLYLGKHMHLERTSTSGQILFIFYVNNVYFLSQCLVNKNVLAPKIVAHQMGPKTQNVNLFGIGNNDSHYISTVYGGHPHK